MYRSGRAWLIACLLVTLFTPVLASIGDRLPEFQECTKICEQVNCGKNAQVIPFHLRVLLWSCQSNCDHTCQHIVTKSRISREPPLPNPIVQFHGKWPFYRLLGIQEPASVLFSLFNLLAHWNGLRKIRANIPAYYTLRPYYLWLGYIGEVTWLFSMLFHTRDFNFTEKLDYYAAGASVFYGMYYTPIRIFRLDKSQARSSPAVLRLWTCVCILLYATHVTYLGFVSWNYTYNMAANVAAGILQNILWTVFSIRAYKKVKKHWLAWPGMIVAWIILAMSLELLDFPPINGILDAHSLWHLGTVIPTIWWYNFLVKDAQQDLAGERLKA